MSSTSSTQPNWIRRFVHGSPGPGAAPAAPPDAQAVTNAQQTLTTYKPPKIPRPGVQKDVAQACGTLFADIGNPQNAAPDQSINVLAQGLLAVKGDKTKRAIYTDALTNHKDAVYRLLREEKGPLVEDMVSALGPDHPLLNEMSEAAFNEVAGKQPQQGFMRANEIFSKVAVERVRQSKKAQAFLTKSLKTTVQRIQKLGEGPEVDPDRIGADLAKERNLDLNKLDQNQRAAFDEEVKGIQQANAATYNELVVQLIGDLESNLDEIPPEILADSARMYQGFKALFPQASEEEAQAKVGAHLILRIVNPGLSAAPTLGRDEPFKDPKQKRTAIMVSKILQNMANNRTFDKEPKMEVFNDMVTDDGSPDHPMARLRNLFNRVQQKGSSAVTTLPTPAQQPAQQPAQAQPAPAQPAWQAGAAQRQGGAPRVMAGQRAQQGGPAPQAGPPPQATPTPTQSGQAPSRPVPNRPPPPIPGGGRSPTPPGPSGQQAHPRDTYLRALDVCVRGGERIKVGKLLVDLGEDEAAAQGFVSSLLRARGQDPETAAQTYRDAIAGLRDSDVRALLEKALL